MKPGTLLGFLFAILVGIVAVKSCVAEPPRREVGVTRDLFGRWTTDDPRYADRYLEIRSSEIVFGRGQEGEARHRLAGVWVEGARQGRRRYLVRYFLDDKRETEVEMAVLSAPGELQLETLPEVRWQPAQ